MDDSTNQILRILLTSLLLFLSFDVGILTRAQESTKIAAQTANAPSGLKSEVIAPGIEHVQITRGYKSDKEATGPWFINMLRIDLRQSRLRLVHALDKAVGLETVSSMASRYCALAAVNSAFFLTTRTQLG